MTANERRRNIILRLRHLCRKSTKLVGVIDDDIDELVRDPEELIKFGAICQRMSSIAYELAVTGDVTQKTLVKIRQFRKAEECEHTRRWLGKLEDSLGSELYRREHQTQQTLGDYK